MARKPPKGMMKMTSTTIGETGTTKKLKGVLKKPPPKGKKFAFRRKTP